MLNNKKSNSHLKNKKMGISSGPNCLDRESCPDENIIGLYLENLLTGRKKTKLVNHLQQCPDCQEQIKILTEIKTGMEDEKNLIPFPDKLKQNAIDLFSLVKPPNILDIAIEFVKGQWEILKHTGVVLNAPALAVTRGEGENKSIPSFQIRKEFNTCIIKANIENIKNDIFILQLEVTDKKKNLPLKKVDIKLINLNLIKERKLEEIICDGQTTFEYIRSGVYKLELSKGKEELGQINLEINKEEGKKSIK